MLVILGTLAGYEMRRIVFFRRVGCPGAAMRRYRRMAWALGLGVWGAMGIQEAVLFFSGMLTWQTGLPLHLCSLAGVMTLPMLVTGKRMLWHFQVYLGLPGAALALLFPALPQTLYPEMARASFFLLHVLLMLSALLPFSLGIRPQSWGAAQAFAMLMVLGTAVIAVNTLLGSNYLFLSRPVEGTPLTLLARGGEGMYRLWMAGLAGLVLAAEGAAAYGLWERKK